MSVLPLGSHCGSLGHSLRHSFSPTQAPLPHRPTVGTAHKHKSTELSHTVQILAHKPGATLVHEFPRLSPAHTLHASPTSLLTSRKKVVHFSWLSIWQLVACVLKTAHQSGFRSRPVCTILRQMRLRGACMADFGIPAAQAVFNAGFQLAPGATGHWLTPNVHPARSVDYAANYPQSSPPVGAGSTKEKDRTTPRHEKSSYISVTASLCGS